MVVFVLYSPFKGWCATTDWSTHREAKAHKHTHYCQVHALGVGCTFVGVMSNLSLSFHLFFVLVFHPNNLAAKFRVAKNFVRMGTLACTK